MQPSLSNSRLTAISLALALGGIAVSAWACSFHTKAVNKCDQLFAGAPAMIPSKSSG